MKRIVKGLIVCLTLFGLVALGSLTEVKAEVVEKSIELDLTGGGGGSPAPTTLASLQNAINENADLTGKLSYELEKNSASNSPGFFKESLRTYPGNGNGGAIKFTLNSETIRFTKVDVSALYDKVGDNPQRMWINGSEYEGGTVTASFANLTDSVIIKNCFKATSSNQLKITKVTLYYQTEGTGGEENTAITDFEALQTRSSLRFTYSQDGEDFVINNLALRFGITITKELYDKLIELDVDAEFGVMVMRSPEDGLGIINADAEGVVIQPIAPARVAEENATAEDPEGSFYQFAFVVDQIPLEDIKTFLTATVYVKIDGVYHYVSVSAEHSVQSIVWEYLELEIPAVVAHKAVLEYLALEF